MADQLEYNGRKTIPVSTQMPREEDRYYEFEHVLGPASAIKEACFKIVDSDGVDVVVLTLENDPTQVTFTEDNKGRVWIKHANTSGLPLQSSYRCGIELIDQNDLYYTPVLGVFLLSDDVINDNGTAPYLTWVTRQDLTDTIVAFGATLEGIKTCNNLTSLTVAASATDTTITVSNGEVCPAASTIRIMLDTNMYDERTVSTQVGNVLTFSGGLSYSAAIDSIVRRV